MHSRALFAVTLVLTAVLAACSSPEKQFQQLQTKIQGLTATTQTITDAWVRGDVSPIYARTAFQETLQLLDKQRATLNASPKLLLDPRGASLSRDAERLSRTLAALIQDAANRDRAAAQQHVSLAPGTGASP